MEDHEDDSKGFGVYGTKFGNKEIWDKLASKTRFILPFNYILSFKMVMSQITED